MDNHPHFLDFADEDSWRPLDGVKRKLEEILNLEILITNFRLAPSKINNGNYLTIQFENGGETYIAFTGSGVLAGQLERYKDKIPFYAKIIKRDRYFSLS